MTHGLSRHLLRRLAFAFVLVWAVSSLALLLARAVPGDFTSEMVVEGGSRDAIARERARLGLDRPPLEQYGAWLRAAVVLDFGTSFKFGRPVAPLVAERAANTTLLALTALAVATLAGIPLGVVAGSGRGWPAAAIRGTSVILLSLPPLLLSLLLAWLAARTGWLPTGGMTSATASGGPGDTLDLARHLVLPACAIALPLGATLERLQARALRRALAEPCLRAAAARGFSASTLRWRHALRLALTPVVSVYGLIAGGLLSGSLAVELVMAWPGLGRLMYEALLARDANLVAGCAAAGALFVAAGVLLSDVLQAWADPRVVPS
jgi:ABC-type dipeptide/oligopeptide/nickel transport system permease component